MEKLVYGVGINDADYLVSVKVFVDGKRKEVWRCPFYRKWSGMLERCYSEASHLRRPTYSDCKTVSEWHTFSVFKEWMQNQDWQNKALDKDLLVPGNRVYGPDKCIFIDTTVNTFLNENGNARGEWPIGVYFDADKNKFIAQCREVLTGKRKKLGRFSDPYEAHKAWLDFKLSQAKILASQQTDPRVAVALISRYENYQS